jgi:hypothetical protein
MPRLYGAETAEGPFDRFLKDLEKRKRSTPAVEPVVSNQPVVSKEPLDDEICRVAYVIACLWASDNEIAAALAFHLMSSTSSEVDISNWPGH